AQGRAGLAPGATQPPRPLNRAGLGDELFSLTKVHFLCYAYGMHQDAGYSPRSPSTGRRPPAAEIISDGTKLPMVVKPSEDHNIWYESLFSPVIDRSESRFQQCR
ncbi:MAG: hypothetical protein WCA22_06725, partial [Candidatus Binatus sp.]